MHTHTYIHTYMYSIHKKIHACVHYTCTYTNAFMHTCMYTCIHTYIYACRQTGRQTLVQQRALRVTKSHRFKGALAPVAAQGRPIRYLFPRVDPVILGMLTDTSLASWSVKTVYLYFPRCCRLLSQTHKAASETSTVIFHWHAIKARETTKQHDRFNASIV